MRKKFKGLKVALAVCLLGLFGVSCESESVETELDEDFSQLSEAPFKNYIVISESNEVTKSFENEVKKGANEIIYTIPEIGAVIVNSKDADFVKNAMKKKGVVSVIPDYEIKWIPSNIGVEANPPSIGDSEPYYFYDYLWGLDAIDAPEAWNAGFTGQGANVFVLDSGIDADHVEIAANLNTSLSASFVPEEDWNIRPGQYFNHGTHVAGTIAAVRNGVGLIGVAPDAELVAVKVLSEYSGSGAFSWINAGIIYAANNDADVINMSLGANFYKNGKLVDADGNAYRVSPKYIQEIIHLQQRAIDYAYKSGVTLVASAGNDAHNADGDGSWINIPGGLNNVITVSATAPEGYDYLAEYTDYDVPASYTNHGRSLIDVAAPGGDGDVSVYDNILSAGSGGALYWSAGTSMAAPHVSGIAALVIGGNGGEMDPHEITKQIYKTADNIVSNGQSVYYGHGRVNAYRAVTE
ncbi:S8 family peptidase [Autumnicola psychrophila]|uniref:S8 family serine peptidase n=1 Tax=Autumnicola psychrophila TaxID=3075592 RepID=A0ABU3DU96_9FLAO|nr:S8 family serine peptidase [Zunongwangia sp. F225]MDT0687292.1 S8 family serine peptidase [Zunongwangia sp. F225]